jgi:hypothetical protein
VTERCSTAGAILLLGVLGLGGCSWIFVKAVPEDYGRGDRLECTTSPAAPIADTALAASNIAGVLYVAGTVGDKATPAQNAIVTTALVWTIVYVSSAIHGYRATAACRQAVAEDERPRARLFPAPRAAPPGPVPAASPSAAPAAGQQMDDDDPSRRPKPTPAPGF